MSKQNETKKTSDNTLKDLKNFLKENNKPKAEEIKPDIMDAHAMDIFFKQKIKPSFNKIKIQFDEFNFERVDFNVYRRIATFRAFKPLTQFYFKVDIDNWSRQIKIYYEHRYRYKKSGKLIQIQNNETINISFRDIDTINEEMLISLFTKWYMAKGEEIQKHKEYIKNKASKSNNEENNSIENENNEEIKRE